MKVAFIRENAVHEWLESGGIDVTPHFAISPLEALRAVSEGLADAHIENLAAAIYLIETYGLDNLKVAAPTNYQNYSLHFAIRNDWPELASIIDKALEALTPEQHAAIRNHWLSVRYEYGISLADVRRIVFMTVVPVFVVLVLLFLWNRRLRREITERERAEEEVKKLEAQNRQLLKAESLGRMAGSIAHHFNNMLAVVMGNIELAFTDLPQESYARRRIKESMKAAHRAAEISRLLLAYLGQTTARKEPTDLAQTLRESISLLSASLPANIQIKIQIPSTGPVVLGDSVHIGQILSNLFSNALEAMGQQKGEIVLTLGTMNKAEAQKLRFYPPHWEPKAPDYAFFSVSDNGCGMDAETLEMIFDPFFSTKFTGRGLGLSVALGLVRAHDGGITVESSPEGGAAFRVLFPLYAVEPVPVLESEPLVLDAVEEGSLVLLVDDEAMVRDVAGSILEHRFGYEVITARDGSEALEIFDARKNEINLVLLDLSMPGMNGWETLSALRALRANIPVILASGYDEAQVMSEDSTERPQAFLHKPFGIDELKAAIVAAQKT